MKLQFFFPIMFKRQNARLSKSTISYLLGGSEKNFDLSSVTQLEIQPIMWSFFLPKTYDLAFTLNNGESHRILNISKKGMSYVTQRVKDNTKCNVVHKELSFGLRLYGIIRGTGGHMPEKSSKPLVILFLIILVVLGTILFVT